MKKYVEFLLESDVMTGGIRVADNFLESLDYISGSVLRAGFAWNILYQCPYADELTEDKTNFVSYRDKEKCKGCPNGEYCKEFGNMKFSFLYPKDAVPAPLTLKECKAGGTEHCVMDTIAENGKLACSKCGGRMESVKGYVNAKTGKKIKIHKNLSVHTAIDIYSGTALEGSLHSVNALSHGQVFYGFIDDCSTDMIKEGTVVRVGKFSSCGFGKLKVIKSEKIEDENRQDMEKRISQFNERFKFGNNNKEYAPMLFLSDAALGFENVDNKVSASGDYKAIWQNNIFSKDSPLHIEKVFAQNYSYSGFDTSIKEDKDIMRRKDPVILTKGGTSILVSYDLKDKQQAVSELVQTSENGIGKDTDAGFGAVEVCSPLHLLGIHEHKGEEND